MQHFSQQNLHTAINTGIYSDAVLWQCDNKTTKQSIIIHGPLAQLLKRYPEDYALTLVGIEPVTLAENCAEIYQNHPQEEI